MAKKIKTTAYRMNGRKTEVYNISTSQQTTRFSLKTTIILILALIVAITLTILQIQGKVVWFDKTRINESTLLYFGLYFQEIAVIHYLYSLMNGIMLSLTIAMIFPISGKRNKFFTAIIIVIIVVFAFIGMSFVGFEFSFFHDLLIEQTFISNSEIGLAFYVRNYAIFLLMYAASFLFESETE